MTNGRSDRLAARKVLLQSEHLHPLTTVTHPSATLLHHDWT
ncbi:MULTISPECIES: hypothetical protein [Planktothricoides]|uniref:Uncharacterized protein n=1 Tax=Planktothricoides raciborskii GIHE-MW2 TaxID=2792601 RepID=A0AAU8J8R5_9CYAN|nr:MULTISPECIES: hypothetical protein [Planktothricoides]